MNRSVKLLFFSVLVTVVNWGCPSSKEVDPVSSCDVSALISEQSKLLSDYTDAVGNGTVTVSRCNDFKKAYQQLTYKILECESTQDYDSYKASVKSFNDRVQAWDCAALFLVGGTGGGGGTTVPGIPTGNQKGEIVFSNLTRTTVTAKIGSQTVTLAPVVGINTVSLGSTYSISENPGQTITLSTATTKGLGGEVIYFQSQSYVVPAAGKKLIVNFSVPPQYFLLILHATGVLPSGDLYTNFGLSAQTYQKWTSNSNYPKYFGYYKAFTNSNVRFITSKSGKEWANLGLKFVENQEVNLTY